MLEIENLSESLVNIVLIGITTALFLYRYSRWNHGYWEKRGIPYVKPTPFIGSILEMFSTPPPYLEMDRYLKYGPIYGYFERSRPCLTIGDPKLLKQMLVKDFPSFSIRRDFPSNNDVLDSMLISVQGEQWKRIRAIVTPTFTGGKLRKPTLRLPIESQNHHLNPIFMEWTSVLGLYMIGIIKECSKTLIKNLEVASMQGNEIDAKRMFGAFTMDVIASSAFSTKIDSHNDPDNQFVSTAKTVFQKRSGWRYLMHVLFPDLAKLIGVSVRGADVLFFKDITLQIIEERKRTGQSRNDFLQLLLDSSKDMKEEHNFNQEKENGDLTSNHEKNEGNQQAPKHAKSALNINELVAQCVIFFLAGFDTTASTLSYATYCLALNQNAQEKLRKEVDTVLQQNKGELTYETLQEMKYLDNVVSETLRMYPPAARIERVAGADYFLTDLDMKIPKGMVVSVPIYAIHRDKRHYPNPARFDPDRFTPEKRAERDPYAYLPFSIGPRNCVASRFALMEVKTCLVHVINAFAIKRCPRTKVPLDFCQSRGLTTAKEIIVHLEPREKASPVQ